MIQFDEHIFQMGWNHQLGRFYLNKVVWQYVCGNCSQAIMVEVGSHSKKHIPDFFFVLPWAAKTGYIGYIVTPWNLPSLKLTASLPLKIGRANNRSPTHPFFGANMLVSGRVTNTPKIATGLISRRYRDTSASGPMTWTESVHHWIPGCVFLTFLNSWRV